MINSNYTKVERRRKIVFIQRRIDGVRERIPAGGEVNLTLRELIGCKLRPIEGQRFKQDVKDGIFNGISGNGVRSNNSHEYKIK